MQSTLVVLICFLTGTLAQKDPHFVDDRYTIVQLFEWKWDDIADECEGFLSTWGYAGVQISPPNENLIIAGRPWYERYQAVSYDISFTRSGDYTSLSNMISRCNAAGVRIYVDTVLNHMTFMNGTGVDGNFGDYDHQHYGAVPYTPDDFHVPCAIDNYQSAEVVRNCQVAGSNDLNQTVEHVRERQLTYMNELIVLGVAGFRIDLAVYIWPDDLSAIYDGLTDLSTAHGFPAGARPFIYQEVEDLGSEEITKAQYTDLATILEFQVGISLGNAFQGGTQLANLQNWGTSAWNLVNSSDAISFIDNHDTQRDNSTQLLNYKKPVPYRKALAFILAHPYGTTKIISSFAFDTYDQGPPADANENLISPSINLDGSCGNGYVCEHRWPQVYKMVWFRNVVAGTAIENWWSNGDQQIAFSRGNKGFIAITNGGDINERLNTGLPVGLYCDVISGNIVLGVCTGKLIGVNIDGTANIQLPASDPNGILALHVDARVLI